MFLFINLMKTFNFIIYTTSFTFLFFSFSESVFIVAVCGRLCAYAVIILVSGKVCIKWNNANLFWHLTNIKVWDDRCENIFVVLFLVGIFKLIYYLSIKHILHDILIYFYPAYEHSINYLSLSLILPVLHMQNNFHEWMFLFAIFNDPVKTKYFFYQSKYHYFCIHQRIFEREPMPLINQIQISECVHLMLHKNKKSMSKNEN